MTTDLLLEGRHFRLDWSSGYEIGRKAAAQNLSDIVAMGATPTALFVGLGMPPDTTIDWLDALTDGFRDECALVGASVAGGDIARSDTIVLGVTALGDLAGIAPITRSGARPGDQVAIAGRLGYAAAGLALLSAGIATEETNQPLAGPEEGRGPSDGTQGGMGGGRGGVGGSQGVSGGGRGGVGGSREVSGEGRWEAGGSQGASGEGREGSDEVREGLGGAQAGAGGARGESKGWVGGSSPADSFEELLLAHRRPEPPYAQGPRAAALGATAMVDVSDGLVQDLGHVAEASGVGVVVEPAAFRVPAILVEAARYLGVDPLDWILTGGDDHALAATFPPGVRLPPPWQVVGEIVQGQGVQVKGRAEAPGGWDHFRG
ncbi:thiamine-monophosphate kinase [Acrocarpospora sp. B8E8]|uniref:thiamine-monophosphate kinase n=1 Tax=Acrocarpospora sp. B8E8 TaxID=3153572 RepID=UPI00325CF5AE